MYIRFMEPATYPRTYTACHSLTPGHAHRGGPSAGGLVSPRGDPEGAGQTSQGLPGLPALLPLLQVGEGTWSFASGSQSAAPGASIGNSTWEPANNANSWTIQTCGVRNSGVSVCVCGGKGVAEGFAHPSLLTGPPGGSQAQV